jgi:hypothetical protein
MLLLTLNSPLGVYLQQTNRAGYGFEHNGGRVAVGTQGWVLINCSPATLVCRTPWYVVLHESYRLTLRRGLRPIRAL